MKLEHAALWVKDLEGEKDFFIKYFGAFPNEGYHNEKTGFRSYFLSFGDGARLEIMSSPLFEESEKSVYRSGYAHVAISLGSKAAVDELSERFKAEGFEILSGPRTTGDGYYESAIIGFEGNVVEITE